MPELLHWSHEPPALRAPALIVALEGFVDAGGAAGSASMFLRHRWRAEPVATFDGDALIDYRARRPTAVVDNGVVRRLQWPKLQLLAARLDGPRDALLLLGPEPDMAWEAFVDAVVGCCERLKVELMIALGAYPAAAAHTRPINIVRADNGVETSLAVDAVEVAGYTGPVGVATAVQSALKDAGVPALGLWAEIPHYISGTPNPLGSLALVQRVAEIIGVSVDTTELEAAAKLHREQVDEAVAEHEEAAAMIAGLEQFTDAGEQSPDLPSGDELAAELERFLRSQEG